MPPRPNIWLIMTDQQRADTIGALGNPVIQTPTLDRLCAEGTAFTSAYCASPVCVASRCSLVLGEYPHQTGCTANTPMPLERRSMMERLQEAGYQTHGVGKMHFSPRPRFLWGFESRDYSEEGASGDDDFVRYLAQQGYGHIVAPHGERSEYYYIPQPSQLPAERHHTAWCADRSIQFLQSRDRSRPFFLWTSFIKPHPPFENPVPWNRLYRAVEMPLPFVPPDYQELWTYWTRFQNRYKYRDQGVDWNLIRTMRAAYYGAISFIDYQVGRVLAELERQGVLDQTLILFTSDHGEMLGDYHAYGKRSMLDPAVRVPLVVRFPDRFPAGRRVEAPVSLIDLLPTILAAAGISEELPPHGLDLAVAADGDQRRRSGVLAQFSHRERGLYLWCTEEFKYIYSAADQKEWLLFRRPGLPEDRNLAGNPAFEGTLRAMRSELITLLREDGYTEPLDGDHWRTYERLPIVPTTPDAAQLFQDLRSVADRFPPGYRPRVNP
ncbi:MAG: arylsulfatase [Candidatus Poribacteria bacterium]|nr:MAG: arylsulfatase [Candidatus Poribacteria bacterium]